MGPVALHLLGEANAKLSGPKDLRFGKYGSLAVDLEKGTYFDHEQKEGGGVIDLVCRERGLANREAAVD